MIYYSKFGFLRHENCLRHIIDISAFCRVRKNVYSKNHAIEKLRLDQYISDCFSGGYVKRKKNTLLYSDVCVFTDDASGAAFNVCQLGRVRASAHRFFSGQRLFDNNRYLL